MDRVKLTLIDQFHFSTNISIRITDLNYGGHVGNDTFLSLIHEARQQFLNHFSYSELQFAGTSLIMVDAVLEYKKELYFGDVVKASVAATGFDKLGFDLHYKLEVFQEEKLVLAAKAKTGMLCYDYANKKKVHVPDEVIKKLTFADH